MANAILRQADLTRYAKALRKADVEEWRVIAHPDGSHEIVALRTLACDPVKNDWDAK
ncbi:hypothetical protein [uncultured Sulfitobacter sp.]|uniref:hypothetical protein n=1 Tax=uncultured Sulfitobacter sp. TaxID=191468 RepID=UPI0030DB80E1|tara:strand:- start:17442 stop:17612 length:171 start_codon:yes stop_codon:yes gene_type:complete